MQPFPDVTLEVAEALPTLPLPVKSAPALPVADNTGVDGLLTEPATEPEETLLVVVPTRVDPAVDTKPEIVSPDCIAVAVPPPIPEAVSTPKEVCDLAAPLTLPLTGFKPDTLYTAPCVIVAQAADFAAPVATALPVVVVELETFPPVVAEPAVYAAPDEVVLRLPALLVVIAPVPAIADAVLMLSAEPFPAEDAEALVIAEEPDAIVPEVEELETLHGELVEQAKDAPQTATKAMAKRVFFILISYS